MALVTMSEILKDATERKYAVGCFYVVNLEMIRGIIMSAEMEKSPVIICHSEGAQNTPMEVMAPIMINEAMRAGIPVCVHLDHEKDFSTLVKAMKFGFTSIMYDGSTLPLKENIKNAKEIVKIARIFGVSVEAELGHVAFPESEYLEGKDYFTEGSELLYTNPDEAYQFAEETHIDALAVAYGTVHGKYVLKPKLDFERLERIKNLIGIPLVMHGGSGLSTEEYVKSIECGIAKINYYSSLAFKISSTIKEKLNNEQRDVYFHDVVSWSIEAIIEHVTNIMKIFGSSGKA